MMSKLLKLGMGLGALYAISVIGNKLFEFNEEKMYSYISFEFPGGSIATIQIKEIPKSKCERIREEYFQAAHAKCTGCKVVSNECRAQKPALFDQALTGQQAVYPYIFKPYKFPEVTFFQGFPREAFPQFCEMEKKSLANSVCVP